MDPVDHNQKANGIHHLEEEKYSITDSDETHDNHSVEMNGTAKPEKLQNPLEAWGTPKSPDPPSEPPKTPGFRALFKYPRGTYFCLGNEFAERFSFYGMKAILTLYLVNVHGLTTSYAKLIYHLFICIAYFTPIFGSILSDGFFGRYRVILVGSIVYVVGHVLLTSSAIPNVGDQAMRALDYTGLFVIALATGCIKPCVSAFAADQFPNNMAGERLQFFSFFYFMINLGALMSQIITPILRHQPCLGSETCFPLAFGVPAIFMFLALIVFASGTPFYKITKVRDNIIWRIFKCSFYALKQKFGGKQPKKMHWLDYAAPKYDQSFIEDVKTMFNIMLLFLPVVLFWALFEQQGSTWVLQADQMNGRIGRLTILPEQMGVLNPVLIILLVPLFEGVIYPILAKCNFLTRPLRRMGWGGFLAAVSFGVGGFLQLAVDKTMVYHPTDGLTRITVSSFSECASLVIGQDGRNMTVMPGFEKTDDLKPNVSLMMGESGNCRNPVNVSMIPHETGSAYFIALFDNSTPLVIPYELKKTKDGKTRIYVMFEPRSDQSDFNSSIVLYNEGVEVKGTIPYGDSYKINKIEVAPELIGSNEFKIFLRKCPIDNRSNCTEIHLTNFNSVTGAAHVLIVPAKREKDKNRLVEVIAPNSISILWQVPQYVIITVGEMLLSISGLAFSYSQASPQMKSVFQAIWLLTSSFGNAIDMALSGSGMFEDKPALEFFVYGAIMAVVMILFVGLAWRYKDKNERQD